MLHQFRTAQGDIEVTVAKQGDVWHLGEHQAIVEDDGRLSIHLSNGMKGYATTAKVGAGKSTSRKDLLLYWMP